MENIKLILDYIRGFFHDENPRKRRAADPLESGLFAKHRRLAGSHHRNIDDYLSASRPFPITRTSFVKTSPRAPLRPMRAVDTIVLDDEDDDLIEIKKPTNCTLKFMKSKSPTFSSTPADNRAKRMVNGDDEDVKFVKEFKSPLQKKIEAGKVGLNYIKPNSSSLTNGSLPKISPLLGAKPKERGLFSSTKPNNRSIQNTSLDYSIRLDDKMQYKKLLESASANSSSNDSSMYHTPLGKLFNYDTSNRSARILKMTSRTPDGSSNFLNGSREKKSTKETIIKVLDEFDNGRADIEQVEVKDSDSDSDVVIVRPPTPKPDIKVDPINSLKTIVDTSKETKKDWLDDVVERHRKFVEEREKEIQEYKHSAEEHNKINRDLRLGLLTSKINRSLSIKDIVLPVEEREEEVELPVLTEQHLKLVSKALTGDPNEVLARKFNLNITRRDLQTLSGLNWLNDEVINFYMNLITARGKDPKWPKTYSMNTFFYVKLINDGPQSLRRWTKKVDIFAHDLICVPIHLGMHWCMAIIDFRNKSIKYYDSMGGRNNKCLNALSNYLRAEHLDKKKTEYDTSGFVLENVKEIPQQMNGSDCGMFACTFAEYLTRNVKITFSQEDMPYFRRKMVVEIMTGELLIQ